MAVERCRLPRSAWGAIADHLKRVLNERLKEKGLSTSRWSPGVNQIERLLGRELCVLAWGVEAAPKDLMPNAIRNWVALKPEERWWLFSMAGSLTGMADDVDIGWRKAIRVALTENPTGEEVVAIRAKRPKLRRRLIALSSLSSRKPEYQFMNVPVLPPKVIPFSLKDAPSLIERLWPAQKISVEAQKERKANLGQTLTGLGSYWKGRKPLILVRACVLAALVPATSDSETDLAVFELLMGMSDDQIRDRFKKPLTVHEIETHASQQQRAALLEDHDGRPKLKRTPKHQRNELMSGVLARMPYELRVEKLRRPEEVLERLACEQDGTSQSTPWDRCEKHN